MLDWQISAEYVLSAVGLFAAWCVRLEVRHTGLEKDMQLLSVDLKDVDTEHNKSINALLEKHNALDSKIANELSEIKQALARIEAVLHYQERMANKGND